MAKLKNNKTAGSSKAAAPKKSGSKKDNVTKNVKAAKAAPKPAASKDKKASAPRTKTKSATVITGKKRTPATTKKIKETKNAPANKSSAPKSAAKLKSSAAKKKKQEKPKSKAAKPAADKKRTNTSVSAKKSPAKRSAFATGKKIKVEPVKPKQIVKKYDDINTPDTAAVSVPAVPKVHTWYFNISSLTKSEADPKGTILVVKDKHHEIGVNVTADNDNVIFTYYQRGDLSIQRSVPLKELIKFIQAGFTEKK